MGSALNGFWVEIITTAFVPSQSSIALTRGDVRSIQDGVKAQDSLTIRVRDDSTPEETGSPVLDRVVDLVAKATRTKVTRA